MCGFEWLLIPWLPIIGRPFGFQIDDATVRRAGLDYWSSVDLAVYDSVEHFVRTGLPTFSHAVFFSKHAKYGSTELAHHRFPPAPTDLPLGRTHDIALMFGNEVQGIGA